MHPPPDCETRSSEVRNTVWRRFILPITGHFRAQRAQLLRDTFPDVDEFVVCDLGGSKHFWVSISAYVEPREVDVVNIDTHAIDVAGGSDRLDADRFRFEIYDGKHIDRPDDHYDLLLCNSVIEHVPPSERVALAAEMARVSRRLFVQTPARAFPIDPHFVMPLVHWLPRPMGRRLARVSPWRLMTRSSARQCDQYFDETRLLGKRELERLFPDGFVRVERVLGLPKSYVLIWDRTGQRCA